MASRAPRGGNGSDAVVRADQWARAPVGHPTIALSTGSAYTYGLARVFAMAANAGYDGIELIVDERWDTRHVEYLRTLSADTGVVIRSIHSPFPSARIAGWPADEIGRIAEAVRLCEAVGARTLNVHLPERFAYVTVLGLGRKLFLPYGRASGSMQRFATWLRDGSFATMQTTTGVQIAIENLPMRRILGRKVHAHQFNAWREFAQFDAVCLDTTHLGTTGADLLEIAARLGRRIVHVHLSDYDGQTEHLPPGKGILPLEPFVQWLGRRQFGGVIVIELSPHVMPANDEARLTDVLRRAREFTATAYANGWAVDAPSPRTVAT